MRPTLLPILALLSASALAAQTRRYALDSLTGLRLHNVTAEVATLDGKRGVRLTVSPDVLTRLQALTPEQQTELAQRGAIPGVDLEQLAVVDDVDFSSGVIEAEIAGAPAPNAGAV